MRLHSHAKVPPFAFPGRGRTCAPPPSSSSEARVLVRRAPVPSSRSCAVSPSPLSPLRLTCMFPRWGTVTRRSCACAPACTASPACHPAVPWPRASPPPFLPLAAWLARTPHQAHADARRALGRTSPASESSLWYGSSHPCASHPAKAHIPPQRVPLLCRSSASSSSSPSPSPLPPPPSVIERSRGGLLREVR